MNSICPGCGSPMTARTISSGNFLGILKGLIYIAVGIALFFILPICGWVLGPRLSSRHLGILVNLTLGLSFEYQQSADLSLTMVTYYNFGEEY